MFYCVSWSGALLSKTAVFLSSEHELRRVGKTCGLQQPKKIDALMTNKAGPHNTGYTTVWRSVSSPAPPRPPTSVFLCSSLRDNC